MKKLIAIALALCVICSFAACGNTNNGPEIKLPASALEMLETVWASYGEDEKFMSAGGDADGLTDGAPGAVTDKEYMQYTLYVPEAHLDCVTEAASLLHMWANNFTAAAYKVTDITEFVTDMQTSIQNTQWMCGFPEVLLIMTLGDYAVVVFGNAEVIADFQAKLVAAYPDAVVAVNEPIM